MGFFAVLPLASSAALRCVRAPLLGPLIVGIVFGDPVAGWLPTSTQSSLAQLGYLGLVLMVLHAGLASDLRTARQSLLISVAVASTGILFPIGLSMLYLSVGLQHPPIQAFTAGASLSTTSLGTTFSLLRAAKLSDTRLGAVLTWAALEDDVVGLILLRIVQLLATEGSASISGWDVSRPIVVSMALLMISWISTRWILWPIAARYLFRLPNDYLQCAYLLVGGLMTTGFVAAAAYAGTSVLLGAFIAGLVLASLDSIRSTEHDVPQRVTIEATYATYVASTEDHFLSPLFFASIGFSVPLRDLFQKTIVWQGFLYALLMTLGKVFCGIWVIKIGQRPHPRTSVGSSHRKQTATRRQRQENSDQPQPIEPASAPSEDTANDRLHEDVPLDGAGETEPARPSAEPVPGDHTDAAHQATFKGEDGQNPADGAMSPSYVTASVLCGLAMTARGEIGLLISQVAFSASSGTTRPVLPSDLFLVATWAILICTVIGPVAVGFLIAWMRKTKTGLPLEWR